MANGAYRTGLTDLVESNQLYLLGVKTSYGG